MRRSKMRTKPPALQKNLRMRGTALVCSRMYSQILPRHDMNSKGSDEGRLNLRVNPLRHLAMRTYPRDRPCPTMRRPRNRLNSNVTINARIIVPISIEMTFHLISHLFHRNHTISIEVHDAPVCRSIDGRMERNVRAIKSLCSLN